MVRRVTFSPGDAQLGELSQRSTWRDDLDILLASTFRLDGLNRFTRGGGLGLADSDCGGATQYIWRQGRHDVVVERDGDSWKVLSTTTSRLFGPRHVLYEARHKFARNAAWDVMACVIRASRNEDEGVNAGREAARWMVERRVPNA